MWLTMKKKTTPLLIQFLLVATGWAAEPRDIVMKSQLDGSMQHYVELLPPAFDATKACDVVLALHGHGSDRWQFIRDRRVRISSVSEKGW